MPRTSSKHSMQRNPVRTAGGLGGRKYKRHQPEKLCSIRLARSTTRHGKPVAFRSRVRHPCLAVQAKTNENQPEFPPRVTTKRQERGKMPGSMFACSWPTGRLFFLYTAAKPCPEFAHPAKSLFMATGMHQPGRRLPGPRCKAHERLAQFDAMLSCRPVQPLNGA